ncbi:hypothetical protein LAZ67_X000848 [Cordylochernes scorpioides]|uniref:GIY-YIG domain-containing protein n=1 Tax=Cordylochernes scorpioides TaxID=51811 RepID=A0ABY6LRZ0_9ARAC|nr:hypothetical protein LAZ67_X000848 [Cordylochernes scorpioides]
MLDCVKHIALSYTAIKQTTLNSCWKKLWPNVVKNEHSISTLNEYSQIAQMAHSLGGEGFDDFTDGDIAELMTDKELSEDDLGNLVCESESDKSDEEELVPVTFTAKVIREGLALGRKLGNHFMQNDTNVERALRFQCDINRCLAQYEEVYKDLTKNSKQFLITDFITISHNVNISASNIESAQITSSDESEFEPSIPKKRMRASWYETPSLTISRSVCNLNWRIDDPALGDDVLRLTSFCYGCERIARKLKYYNITTRFQSTSNLNNILRHPDTKKVTEPNNRTNVIYKIPCKSCQAVYIGETGKPLIERISQHKSALKHHNPTSLLVDHALINGHIPDFEQTSIIHQDIKEKHSRLFLEKYLKNQGFKSLNLARLRKAVTKMELQLVQVTLPKTSQSKQIFNVTRICDMICKLEAYTAPKAPGQCHRFRNYGTHSTNADKYHDDKMRHRRHTCVFPKLLHNPLNFQLPLTSERRAKDHIISSLSNKLLDFLEDNSLTIVNGRSRGDKDGDFTYISERGSSTIDYCILSQGSLQILLDFKVDDQLYSDHHPLVLTIKGQNFNEKKTKREDYNITRYRWSADGLAMFKMKLEELREKNIPASDDLEYTFNQRILEAMSSAKITYSIKGGPRKSKPWFDKDCYDMKKLAKESLKKYRKTNRLEDRECYASSRKKYLALLDLKRKGFDNEKQEILRNAKDSKTFWKTIALYKSTSIIQGEISIQDWLNFYRELMTTEKNLRICNLHNVISQNDPLLDSEITNADIYKEIAGLRSNKACGPDGIPNEVLKTLPDSYILLLKQLYNSVMTTGKYPAIWTNSTIHPIFKNGYKNSPSNYRGISYQFISTIRSYYEQATIAIRWKGSFTESIKINSGVLQGEPLSPLLFILFITDLIEIYNNSDLPSVNLPEFGDIHLLLYADDIAIIGKPSNKDRWFWNDKPITITSRYTYLGFPLTPTITTTHPANYFKGKALTAINATHPILIKSKAKSINLSTKLFDTIVRAVLMYAAPLWATEHKDLLDSIQDIFIRRFLNLPRYTPGYLIRLETGRISLSVTALKLTLKYWLRVLNMSSDRLPRICFNRTRELSNASGTPIGFIKKLTNLLNNNGSPALVSCDDPETLRSAITGLLKIAADQSIQNDLTRMDKSKLYSHYKDIHISFMTEGYLLGDFPFPVVRLLAQVRILSSFFRENHTKMLCGAGLLHPGPEPPSGAHFHPTEPNSRRCLQVPGNAIALDFLKVKKSTRLRLDGHCSVAHNQADEEHLRRNSRPWFILLVSGGGKRGELASGEELGRSRGAAQDGYAVLAHQHTHCASHVGASLPGRRSYIAVPPALGACRQRAPHQSGVFIPPSLLLRRPCSGHSSAAGPARTASSGAPGVEPARLHRVHRHRAAAGPVV